MIVVVMVETNHSRREVLNKTASAGAVTGLVVGSNVVKALPNSEEGLVKTKGKFLEFGIGVSRPKDAIMMSSTQFPTFLQGNQGNIYISDLSKGLENKDGVLCAAPEGLRLVSKGEDLAPSMVPLSTNSDGRGKRIGMSEFKESIILEEIGEKVIISFGNDRFVVNEGDNKTDSKSTEIQYKGIDGIQTRKIKYKIKIKYKSSVTIFSHNNLTLVPKNSPGGHHIRETIIPELKKRKGEGIGNWKRVYNLIEAKAWGINRLNGGEL